MTTVDILFMTIISLTSAAVIGWGARVLPAEKWQILAAVPGNKRDDGTWAGRNLTYYGVIVASAYTVSVSIFLLLMSSTGASMTAILIMTGLVLVVCVPASKLLAIVVEKKRHTFTVGGASFVGMIVAPWIWYAIREQTGSGTTVTVSMAALAIAYAFGEGFGRLACISFGCCYGRRVADLSPFWQKIFRRFHFTFTGQTKKIAYAHGWDGQPVIPVQLITSVLYIAAGLTGIAFFLNGLAAPAFLIPLMTTQLWRVLSEFLRADFRGEERRLTAYQIMALATIPYAGAVALIFGAPAPFHPDIAAGLKALWRPGVLLSVQLLWLLIFLQTGRSMVTGSRMSFFFHQDRI
ncbi:MAG: prolipoprotein diacylglyceryl transferase [Thermodesulfobacteriota bacterium]